jgi:DNA-binding GntR family transcriptional regulator
LPTLGRKIVRNLSEPPALTKSSSKKHSARRSGVDSRRSQKAKRLSLVDQAYRELKRRVLSDEYHPGFQATELEIAGQLAMSRTPVREALLKLQNDGLVALTPRHGFRVLPIYPADLRDIYQLLCCLESTAAELLAGRQLASDAPEFLEMEAVNNALEQAVAKDDLDAFARLDDRFHQLLVVNSGNERLARIVMSISDQQRRARYMTLRMRPRPAESSAEHRAVLEAIRRGDGRTASELHRAHRRRTMNLILGLIEHYRLGQL